MGRFGFPLEYDLLLHQGGRLAQRLRVHIAFLVQVVLQLSENICYCLFIMQNKD